MAFIETTRQAPLGAVSTLRIVNAVDSLRAAIVNGYQAVKTEKALSKLSDAQLEDIGLVRNQIHTVAQRTTR